MNHGDAQIRECNEVAIMTARIWKGNMEELKKHNRQKRGQVSETEIKQHEGSSIEELARLLNSSNPKSRTIGAVLMGNKKATEMIPELCKHLQTEKSLYSRIAVSEALGKMGEPAVKPLIQLLGKIGNNQEKELPKKYFEKRSYPLARDLAARTLIKIGKPAIPYLIKIIENGDSFETQQAIDAIGGIASKNHDVSPLPVLLEVLEKYSGNEVTTWKVIRALSAFKHMEVIEPLVKMLKNHTQPAIRWEAARSIGQVGISTPEVRMVLKNAIQDQNIEVRKAAKISLGQLQ